MQYRRAALVAVLALGVVGACASSRPEGTGIDAADTINDDADTSDGADTTDATETDASAIDATAIDATPIDAAPSDGVMPIDAPIDANTCPTAPCDLYAQCGCTSPLVCDLDFTDLVGNSCRAVNMPGTETSTCYSGNPATAQPSYCAGGYVCLGSGTGAACERYCDASTDCGQPRGQCVIQVTNGGTPIPNVQVCSSNCDPANSATGPCPAGQTKCGLYYVNNALTGNQDRDIALCTAPGAGTQGAACGTAAMPNDALCAANYTCSNYNNVVACRRVCNLTTGGNECASVPGTSCLGFNPALVIGGASYGICR